nr:kelch repeat-containing protein [Colletotrichum truncatum]KAF6783177.1 kelch repeat-containing protein [Colletotrichum truncatum]
MTALSYLWAITIGISSFTQAQDTNAIRLRGTNNSSGSWEDLAPISNLPRQEHAAVAINSTTLAIIGGITGSNATGAWINTDLVDFYDTLTDTWASSTPLPVALNHPNAAVVNGKIYVFGGLAESSDQNGILTWRAIPDSWVYDSTNGRWTSIAPFPIGTERGSAAVGVFGKTVFLAGGLRYMETAPGGTTLTVDEVSAYDTVTDTWISFASIPLPQPRDHAGGAVVGSNFYVIGGRHIASRLIVSNTVYVLDLEDVASGWEVSSATLPTARAGHGTTVIGSVVYTFGGEGNFVVSSGVFDETETFDTRTESWQKLRPMEHPRHGIAAVAIEDRIYIPGGGVAFGAAPVNVTDVFRP